MHCRTKLVLRQSFIVEVLWVKIGIEMSPLGTFLGPKFRSIDKIFLKSIILIIAAL